MKLHLTLAAGGLALVLHLTSAHGTTAQGAPRFTVADEIGLAHFGDPYLGQTEALTFSPDRRFVAVHVERGLLQENRPQDELRVYEIAALKAFLESPAGASPPAALRIIRESTFKEGTLISNVRWLADSSALTFLQKNASGRKQLMWTALRANAVEPLSPADQDVTAYDVRDRTHYVYAAHDPAIWTRPLEEAKQPAVVLTGRPLKQVLFGSERDLALAYSYDRSVLWAAIGAAPALLLDPRTKRPHALYRAGLNSLSLSPDGRSIVTALAVDDVPAEWKERYRPASDAYPYGIVTGPQDTGSLQGPYYISQYARIDPLTGEVTPLTPAPTGASTGWHVTGSPKWSADGRVILLPSTFGAARGASADANRPCVTVVDVAKRTHECVEPIKARWGSTGPEAGFYQISDVHFADAQGRRVRLEYYTPDGASGERTLVRTRAGAWQPSSAPASARDAPTLEVEIRQSMNDPPVLVAKDATTGVARVVWDPNPQIAQLSLVAVTIYRWQDATQRRWSGGLFKPADHVPGKRYPLVIQTHGFNEREFRPSGIYPAGFAARALADVGFIVLQMKDCAQRMTSDEGPCNVRGYAAAIEQMSEEGLIDRERIGIVGFSRTCGYVLHALTAESLKIRAASITDGVNQGYLQYLFGVDFTQDRLTLDAERVNGDRPFGAGLQRWMERTPTFNLHKVNTPLQIVGTGPLGTLFMWEPYAVLRALGKPVDLVMLNTNEHVFTNPATRLASQGGTVDWMRFWLQDFEDPDLAKAAQYTRWRALRRD